MSKEKLLVLDDEPRILTALQDLFEDDYEVLTTTSAGEALCMATEQDVVVVLTDERMPGLSGHEFLERIKGVSKATRMMISGYADIDAVTAAVNRGQIFAYVSKPWDPQQLRATVTAAMLHFKLNQTIDHERELLRGLMEGMPDPIYFKDSDSRFTRINRAHSRVLGIQDVRECVGRRDSDFFEAEYSRRTLKEELEIVRSGQPLLDRIEQLRTADGSFRWLSTNKVPIFDPSSGLVSGIAGITRDITELKNGRKGLELLYAVTVGANESSTIEQAAQICLDQICAHTCWSKGRLYLPERGSENELSNSAGAGLAARVLASASPEWIDLLESAGPGCVILSGSGDACHAGFRSAFAFPILVQRKALGVLEFFSFQRVPPDENFLKLTVLIGAQLGQVVLRQRTKEDLQRAKESAESASRAKSEFLAVMSHEIRTPMNAILGMADLLSATALSPDQQDYVRIFQRAGGKLLNLINDILDLSKVESGRFELGSVDFNLSALLEKTFEIMSARAHIQGLQLTCEVLPDVPINLSGDPDRLGQILINLIGNALKFTKQGGVTVGVQWDGASTEMGTLRFSVADTGIGIPSEKIDMIFANFTQADSSTTRNYGGTGLGLAISRGLVELMGGQIGCTSEVGKGSTFSFTVPFGQAFRVVSSIQKDRPEPILPVPAVRPLVATRILIVEDCADNLFLIKAYLNNPAFELESAENGKVAVEKVISGNYDLVLMDVQMPVMDGYSATRAIREWEKRLQLGPLPILALTADALKEDVCKSKSAGCTAFLSKPINQATLLDAISRHTGEEIRIPPPAGIIAFIPQYLINIRQGMRDILAGIELGDFEIARKLAHQFKGSGSSYGFPEITRAGAAVEVAAKGADGDAVRRQLLHLAACLDRAEAKARN